MSPFVLLAVYWRVMANSTNKPSLRWLSFVGVSYLAGVTLALVWVIPNYDEMIPMYFKLPLEISGASYWAFCPLAAIWCGLVAQIPAAIGLLNSARLSKGRIRVAVGAPIIVSGIGIEYVADLGALFCTAIVLIIAEVCIQVSRISLQLGRTTG